MLVACDIGRSAVKTKAEGRDLDCFPSLITPYYEWKGLSPLQTDDDLVVQLNGKRYFVGSVVEYVADGDTGRRMQEDKVNEYTLIFLMTALYRACAPEYVRIVTGVPMDQLAADKERLEEFLKGTYDVYFTNRHNYGSKPEHRRFVIEDVRVTAEGAGVFFAYPAPGIVRILDLGSRKSNAVTFKNKRYVEPESYTLNFGWDTLRGSNKNVETLAEKLHGELSGKWSEEDKILVAGGVAEELAEALRIYFPNADAVPNPRFANVLGYYEAGRLVYKR